MGPKPVSSIRPFTDAHAIARLDFALIFVEHLTDDQRTAVEARLLQHLSSDGYVESEDDEDDDGDRVYALARTGEADEVTEAVHVHSHYAHVAWFDYRGWSFCRDGAIARLRPVLEMASEGSLELSGVGLAYRDVFFDDDAHEHRADSVLRRGCRYLPAFTFECEGKWRQTVSWHHFMSDAAFGVFANLDVDSGVSRSDGTDEAERHITDISHRQQIYRTKSVAGAVNWDEATLAQAWDTAHANNRDLMVELLTDEMLQRIGLKEGRT